MRLDAVALIPAYSHIDHRLLDALRLVGIPNIAIHGCSDLVRARCRLLSDALRTGARRFVFVDADMVPMAGQLTELIESDRDAVSGTYAVGGGQVAASTMAGKVVELPSPERFIACLVAGMGFASVSREVVERLAEKLPTVRDPNGHQWKPFFLPMLVGETNEYLSEDYAFWWRLREHAGVQLWLDTSLVVGHCKPTVALPKGAP
jgi:DNA-binding transcriptional LysR family regulator